jgi:beta-N-acetylhexosaminidase
MLPGGFACGWGIGVSVQNLDLLKLEDRAQESVARFKKKLAPPHEFSEAAFSKIDHEIWDLRVAVLGDELAKQRSPEDGKRSPVETY